MLKHSHTARNQSSVTSLRLMKNMQQYSTYSVKLIVLLTFIINTYKIARSFANVFHIWDIIQVTLRFLKVLKTNLNATCFVYTLMQTSRLKVSGVVY